MYSRQVIKHTSNKSFKEKNSESRVATRDCLKCPVFNNIIMSMQRIINYGSFLQAYGLKNIFDA